MYGIMCSREAGVLLYHWGDRGILFWGRSNPWLKAVSTGIHVHLSHDYVCLSDRSVFACRSRNIGLSPTQNLRSRKHGELVKWAGKNVFCNSFSPKWFMSGGLSSFRLLDAQCSFKPDEGGL